MSLSLFPSAEETIAGVSQSLRTGQLSCIDVVNRCLAKIDEWEPKINAWVIIDRDGAIQRARELDVERQANRWRGPLHGIPIGIKDIVDVAGFPTAAGSALRAKEIASEDASLVTRLKDAGAIILGKTVTTQFACYDPPPTRNPWNLEHTPGGSSSGSAAAVATGMCLAAIGSQTGGSITRPASFCGVSGCKATFGRVSVHGVVPVAVHLDHPGPIARSVSDLAIMLDAIAGHEPRDAVSANQPNPNVFQALSEEELKPPRIGRVCGFFEELADESSWSALDRIVEFFHSNAATISEVELPNSFDDLHRFHRTMMAFEAATSHKSRFAKHRDDYLPGIASLLEEGLSLSETEYHRAREHQKQAKRDILSSFDNVDVLVCPATIGTAPDRSTTGDPAFNSPWSYTGLPTVSFPIGCAKNGLPLGIQIVGRPFLEADLFRAALWCERVVSKQPECHSTSS